MTLEEGIKQTGNPCRIRCTRLELPGFLAKHGYKRGVEVGVYKAGFTEYFAKAGLEIYGVDPYKAYREYATTQDRQNALYDYAQNVLAPYSNAKIIRKISTDAARDFKDESLDFVYIDGNHGLKYVIEDLWEWNKKVRKGGVISGHDWGHYNPRVRDSWCLHVTHAVEAWLKCMNITNFYIIGAVSKADRHRSWMYFKP